MLEKAEARRGKHGRRYIGRVRNGRPCACMDAAYMEVGP